MKRKFINKESVSEHWIGVEWMESGWYGENTPTRSLFTTEDGKKLHWNGYTQWTVWEEKMVIVHDYGWVDDMDSDKIAAIRRDWKKRYPIEPHDIERAVVKDADGWLAPDGKFYRVGYHGHTAGAQDLVNQFEIRPYEVTGYSNRETEALFRSGWYAVSHGFVSFEHEVFVYRPEQIAFLKRLIELNTKFPHYVEPLQEFVERCERWKNKKAANFDF